MFNDGFSVLFALVEKDNQKNCLAVKRSHFTVFKVSLRVLHLLILTAVLLQRDYLYFNMSDVFVREDAVKVKSFCAQSTASSSGETLTAD